MTANDSTPSQGHDGNDAELTKGESAALELLMEEHDIPGRVPVVTIWKASDGREEFVELAERAAELYEPVPVEVEVPSEVVEKAEEQVEFEEEVAGDLSPEHMTAEERNQLVLDRVHDTLKIEFDL